MTGDKATPALPTGLNYGKLCPPQSRAGLRRPRLLRRLGALSHCKLALLCAEAGYGKTTLVLDFLRSSWPHSAVWYRLGKGDRDVNLFAAYLAEGIAQYLPDFGREIRRRTAEGVGGDTASELPRLLLHEVSTLVRDPLLLILDNFEAVADSGEVAALVSEILEYSGPEVHVAITSRAMPPLPVARLEARQQVVTLGPEDLALTLDETRELLLGLHGAAATDPQMEVLWRRTEGWVAGIIMIAEALHRTPTQEVVASLGEFQGSPDLVYRYFADEVFQNLDPALQQFLLETSVLKRLSYEVVNDLLEIDNGGELLATLRASGVFASGLESDRTHLRYHPLFRSFLLQKLHARYGDAHVSRLYRRAARAASRCRRWSEAVELYAAAGDWEGLGEVLEEVGEELAQRGFPDTVRYWLDLMPEERLTGRPVLLMLRGRLLRQRGRHTEALWYLERAVQGYRERGDRRAEVLTKLEVALAHNLLGEFRVAEAVLTDALDRAGNETPLRSRVLADLVWNSMRRDELAEAVAWGETAAREATLAGPAGAIPLVRALRFRAQALLLQGDLRRGFADANRSLDLCRRERVADVELASSLYTVGQGLLLQGVLDQALDALNQAEPLASGRPTLLDMLWTSRGTAHRDRGTLDRAEQDYRRAESWDPARVELAFLHLLQGRVVEGLRLAEETTRSASARDNPGETAVCQAVYGMALAEAGEPGAGLEQLSGAAETMERRGRQHQLASARWHLARLLLEGGRQAEALQHLEAAVLWMSEQGASHLWWWNPEVIARLWPLAFNAGWAPAYLDQLARSRLGPKEARFLYEALGTVAPVMRSRLLETLRVVSGGATVGQNLASDLLGDCHDPLARRHIAEALASGFLGVQDLARLREEAGLTWKELEVAILYYRRGEDGEGDGRFRRRLAEELALSENTVKVHIRNIRRKLDLPERWRGAQRSPFAAGAAPGPGLRSPGARPGG